MRFLVDFLYRRLNIASAGLVILLVFGIMGSLVLASSTSNFTQTIGAGTLAVDIVNGSYVTVASPTIAMSGTTFEFACHAVTGTFGTASEQIYVKNPDVADGGWTASLGGSATTNIWDSAGTDYDFNDPTGTGCTDGADAGDTVGGQMTVDASGGTLAVGACLTCTTTGVSKGTSGSYSEGVTDNISVLIGAAGSDDVGDWTLRGVSISQKIPAEQPAAADYDINMMLTII